MGIGKEKISFIPSLVFRFLLWVSQTGTTNGWVNYTHLFTLLNYIHAIPDLASSNRAKLTKLFLVNKKTGNLLHFLVMLNNRMLSSYIWLLCYNPNSQLNIAKFLSIKLWSNMIKYMAKYNQIWPCFETPWFCIVN